MKMKRLILILFTILILTGCKKSEVYEIPKGIIYDEVEDKITWEKSGNVIGYILVIDDESYTVNDNYFDFSVFDNGIYKIKIRAVYENGQSIFTNLHTIIKNKKQDNFVYFKDNTLYFKKIVGASYKIIYKENLEEVTFTTDINSFTIPDIIKDRKTSIIIEAYNHNELVDKLNITLNLNITIAYENEPLTIKCNKPRKVYLDENEVNTDFTLYDDQVIIEENFIKKIQSEGFITIVGEEYLVLKVHVVTKRLILLSDDTQQFKNDDVIFNYNSNGYKLISISSLYSPNITDEDYSFQDDKLTVRKDYLQYYFERKPGKNLTLVLQFKIDNYSEIVYLTITQ